MIRMNKIVLAAVAVALLSTAAKCNFSLFGSPSQVNEDVTNAQATPSPTPSASPVKIDSSCEATCEVDSVTIDEGDSVIAIGASKTFNLTPYTEVTVCDASGKPTNVKKKVKTSKECDDPRAGSVQWIGSSNAIEVLGDGFHADVKRVGTGAAVLTATLEGKSFSRNIK